MQEAKDKLIRRLKIIQGQVDGIIKMIESQNPDCEKIMHQMKASKSAFQAVGGEIIKHYLKTCVTQRSAQLPEQEVDKILSLLAKF